MDYLKERRAKRIEDAEERGIGEDELYEQETSWKTLTKKGDIDEMSKA